MQIIKADTLGMCFGVRDALKAIATIAEPESVTIHGELVHNEAVIQDLRERGFPMVNESRRRPLPLTPSVLVTAHGISERERRRLEEAGKQLVDTTCPLVTRAHDAAQALARDGFHVLVIGRRGHVEVQGVIEDLRSYDVIEEPREVKAYSHPRLGIMCQTTTPPPLAQEIRAKVVEYNPRAEIRFIDTICAPTKDHQKALDRLLDRVDGVVVVGGRNSNNTRALVARCRERGVPAWHVQTAADLEPDWFNNCQTVGLTAGTSTLESSIDEVYQTLLTIAEEHGGVIGDTTPQAGLAGPTDVSDAEGDWGPELVARLLNEEVARLIPAEIEREWLQFSKMPGKWLDAGKFISQLPRSSAPDAREQ